MDESQFAAATKLTDIETSRDGADISNRHSDNKFSQESHTRSRKPRQFDRTIETGFLVPGGQRGSHSFHSRYSVRDKTTIASHLSCRGARSRALLAKLGLAELAADVARIDSQYKYLAATVRCI